MYLACLKKQLDVGALQKHNSCSAWQAAHSWHAHTKRIVLKCNLCSLPHQPCIYSSTIVSQHTDIKLFAVSFPMVVLWCRNIRRWPFITFALSGPSQGEHCASTHKLCGGGVGAVFCRKNSSEQIYLQLTPLLPPWSHSPCLHIFLHSCAPLKWLFQPCASLQRAHSPSLLSPPHQGTACPTKPSQGKPGSSLQPSWFLYKVCNCLNESC